MTWVDKHSWEPAELVTLKEGAAEPSYSLFGNGFYTITLEQLRAMERGAVLVIDDGEYREFVRVEIQS